MCCFLLQEEASKAFVPMSPDVSDLAMSPGGPLAMRVHAQGTAGTSKTYRSGRFKVTDFQSSEPPVGSAGMAHGSFKAALLFEKASAGVGAEASAAAPGAPAAASAGGSAIQPGSPALASGLGAFRNMEAMLQAADLLPAGPQQQLQVNAAAHAQAVQGQQLGSHMGSSPHHVHKSWTVGAGLSDMQASAQQAQQAGSPMAAAAGHAQFGRGSAGGAHPISSHMSINGLEGLAAGTPPRSTAMEGIEATGMPAPASANQPENKTYRR